MTDQFDAETGEIIEQPTALTLIDNSALATIARVEIDQQVATARQYPRSIDRAIKNIIALATLDEDTAESCCYALVRKSKNRGAGGGEDNKPIEGPSVRLAEIALTQWGNCRADARVIEINRKEKYVAAEGVFIDLENNVAVKKTVRRRISTKAGHLFSDDMITVTGNAACSIAMRNAVLTGVPRGVYLAAYTKAREIIAGTSETLSANRAKAINAFARFGVTPDQIFDALDVEGDGDIKPSHIATLRAMFSTLKNGESTVEEMFGKPEPDHKVVENPLADDAGDEKGAPLGKGAPEAATGGGDPRPTDTPVAAEQSPQGEQAAEARDGTSDKDQLVIASAADQSPENDAGPKDGTASEAAATDGAPNSDLAAADNPSKEDAAAGAIHAASDNDHARHTPAADKSPPTSEWRDKGRQAALRGMSIKAIPLDLREQGMEAHADEWKTGHAEGVEQRKAKEAAK